VQPAVSDLHCAGFVGVTEDRQPFPDGGPVQFVEGGFPALSLDQREKTSPPGRRDSECSASALRRGDDAETPLQILQVRGQGC
jgi:hypothetical protein